MPSQKKNTTFSFYNLFFPSWTVYKALERAERMTSHDILRIAGLPLTLVSEPWTR